MISKAKFYMKIGYKLFKKDVVNNEDYRESYNGVANTYDFWLEKMGQYTDKIINSNHIPNNNEVKVLDFACGTGYMTKSLLKKNINYKITSVDFSEGMLGVLRNAVGDRVNIVHGDGLEFLKNTEEKFDVIFFGWALSYFDHKELFKLFKSRLNEGGIVAIITNVQGTLDKIEDIFLKVMMENQKAVIKPMEIKFNLPKGKDGLVKWFNKFNFEAIELGEGEIEPAFDKPEELLEWLNKTGVAAGTKNIFNDYEKIKPNLIGEIKSEKYKDGKYRINHKFAYGIFKSV